MYKIDRRGGGGGAKNRILGIYQNNINFAEKLKGMCKFDWRGGGPKIVF